MNLEDIKENLREQFMVLASRVRESTAFIQLSEKYHNLTPNGQRGVLFGSLAAGALILLLIPYTFFSASQDVVADFEDKREVIRELFRVSREAGSLPPEPPQMTAMDLQSQVRNRLSSSQLQPEQIGLITEISGSPIPGAPKAIKQAGVSVAVNKLNLTQLVDIGHQLQIIHPTAKMVGMDVKANASDGHYFDVIYKIVTFSLENEPEPKKTPARRKGFNRPSDDEG